MRPHVKRHLENIFPEEIKRVEESKCPFCSITINYLKDFKNSISRKEYLISGLCQKCQDIYFK